MSKYSKSLVGRNASMVHSTEYKTKDVFNASKGRVMVEGKESIAAMSRPKDRTSYVAGCESASTNADAGMKY